MTTALPSTSTRCRIDLEGWDPEDAARVWSDHRPQALRAGFIELGELLAQLVDTPAGVTLVIPINIAEAVRRREPEVPYTLERGSGLVDGRTMSVPDGRIDVIINAGWLLAFDPHDRPIVKREHMKSVRRTVVHEAQHAIMRQRGSGFDEYASAAEEVETNQQFAHNAAIMCDEHRAEWQAIQLTEPEPPTVSSATAVLEALGRQLAAANSVYQAAPNRPDAVYNLAIAVLTACSHFWASLGYWAAQQRTGDSNIADMPAEIAALPLWQRYGGDVWALLQESLRTLPVEDLTTSPEILCTAMRHVATTLRSSLETIGFRYEDGVGGPDFHIDRWDFPDQ